MFWIERNRVHLGGFNVKPDTCQASLRDCDCQHYEPDGQHLQPLLLPSTRCSEVHPGNVADDGIFYSQHFHMYVYEDGIEEGEQGVDETRGRDWCESDPVPVIGNILHSEIKVSL